MIPIDLDANATTRPLPEVVEVVARHLRDTWGNPGSRHGLGRQARRVLEDSRESIAASLGADPDEVVFTSGGTESNNMAIFGLASSPPLSKEGLGGMRTGFDAASTTSTPPNSPLERGGEKMPGGAKIIALSPGEHPANLEACRVLQQHGWTLRMLPVDDQGRITPTALMQLEGAKLATILFAHNETGVIQDSASLADACRNQQVLLHLDGVQAVGKIPINFHALGATTLSFGAHKFHGPRGIGGLLVRRGTRLTPLLYGGHQEQERRPGTEPVALIAGMATALEFWVRDQDRHTQHLSSLRDRLQAALSEWCSPVVINSGQAPRLPNTLNIAFPGVDGEALLVALDLAGVCCSLGSTCASGSMEPAPMLVAMGCPADVYRSSVRFSVSVENSAEEIDVAVARISTIVAQLRNAARMAR